MNMMLRKGAALAATILVAFGGSQAAEAAQTANGCTAAKYKAVGKCTSQKLKCHAKAVKKGKAVDAACLARSSQKLELAFDRIESKGGCAADDSPLVRSQRLVLAEYQVLITTIVDNLVSEVGCPDKLKAAGRNVVHQFYCHATAILTGDLVDHGCLTDAEDDLVAAYQKSTCDPGGDDPAVTSGIVADMVETVTGTGCSGAELGGACWFLSTAGGLSCDAVCAAQGRSCNETATRDLVGSGAASSAGCFVVADVLGYTPVNHEDLNVCDGTSAEYGIGCHYRGDSLNWARATSPVTTCAATGNIAGVCESNKLRICACD